MTETNLYQFRSQNGFKYRIIIHPKHGPFHRF